MAHCRLLMFCGLALLGLLVPGFPHRPLATAQDAAPVASPLMVRFTNEALTFTAAHCAKCHSDQEPKADLNVTLDRDLDSVTKRRAVWENIVEMVSNGQMPPPEEPRPDQDAIDKFVAVVNAVFEEADRHAKPDPGRVTVRRLNRTEYNNTIRDLMWIDFNAAEDFPSDDIGHGFDNIGDVLTML